MGNRANAGRVGLGVVTLLGLLGGAGCAPTGAQPTATSAAAPTVTSEIWRPGEAAIAAQYQALCASCHGVNLDGGMGGALRKADWRVGTTPEALARVIAEGSLDFSMPAFAEALSPAEIAGLVAVIQRLNPRLGAGAATTASTAARPASLPARRVEGPFASAKARFVAETVVDGLQTPWGLAWLPDGRMLVTERPGPVRVVATDGTVGAPIAGTPRVWARSQGGMLEVAPHPHFAENGWIYLAYSDVAPDNERRALTAVVRGRLGPDNRWQDEETILRFAPALYGNRGVHFGVRLVFHQGYLFVGIGDRGEQNKAQDLGLPNGKVHRVHDDGRVPTDNPYVGQSGALATVWSYGHRNPQGMTLDPATGHLWLTEHGPRGGDELNWVRPTLNYGWPLVCWGINYNGTPVSEHQQLPGIEDPLTIWTPSIAPSGLAFYTGTALPGWRGHLFVGSLVAEELRRLEIDGTRVVAQELVLKGIGRIRDVRVGPDGHLYLALNDRSDEARGRIVRLVPAP